MRLYKGDCLEVMASLPEGCVDMVMCDLPYGTTQNKWDTIIPLEPLWAQYRRLCRGAIVLTAAQPFTSVLVCSNLKDYRYEWIWRKLNATGHLNARKQPMREHENVLLFSENSLIYNAQDIVPYNKTKRREHAGTGNYGKFGAENFQEFTNWPKTILTFGHYEERVHPTQKPVALMEYLIRTYTYPGMTVLDNCMGSGTTGVACARTEREFIGIERDPEYFKAAEFRIAVAQAEALNAT